MQPTRRDFLKTSALAGACALSPVPAARPLDMCAARWTGTPADAELAAETLTRRALGGVGGMGRFVRAGQVVWVKPNMGWARTPEEGANTHPGVVGALVRLCLEAGASRVRVGDHSWHPQELCQQRSGIADAVRRAGGEMASMERSHFKIIPIRGRRIDRLPVHAGVLEADLVISAAAAKLHSAAGVSLCMKNYMGLAENRGLFLPDLPAAITDLALFMKPKIAVLDATRIMTGNGPSCQTQWGGIVAAGVDIVALDAFGAELLGREPESVGTIREGRDRGLGVADYRSLRFGEAGAA